MKRKRAFFIIFVCWGLIVALGSMRMILTQRENLIDFSRKIAEEKIVYYPLRAPIIDCDGREVCYTEWLFSVHEHLRYRNKLAKLAQDLNLELTGDDKTVRCSIPKEKLSSAVKLCRKYRLKIKKRIIRRTADLPENVRCKLGIVPVYSGISGIEAAYNKYLQGTPGIYQSIRSPQKKIATDSFRIMLPMRSGRKVKLKQSLFELQCGILPEVAEVK